MDKVNLSFYRDEEPKSTIFRSVIINNDHEVIRTEEDKERQKTEDSVLRKPDVVYPEILVYVDTTLFR